MARAADRLEAAIERGERICVWGDFDVDGQTATTLLVSTLRDLGGDVIYHIPVRATESHGVKVPWLQQELDRGARVVLTCDTGSDACEAVTCANVYGVDVIITDHHELPAVLPDAHTIVNPHLLSAGHPLETLPGVGVAYKLGEELYRRAGRAGDIEQHLDLVALGIVADLADQIGDARYLLQRGLVALRNTQRLGLREMMKLASLVPAQLNEEHIGFGLAPRLNALGRLDDANVSVEFLTTRDLTRARILASELEALNARRKILGDQVFQAAQAQIERDPALMDHAALVLANPAWPVGVVGIVANRLAELYGRPAILISTPPDQMGRGSARSIEGVHITDAIASQQDLLESFGGHAMAAGLSIDPDKIAEFRRGLSRVVAAQLGEALGRPTLRIDGYVPLSDLSLDLVADLERLAPFGPGNSAPVLATRDLRITAKRTVGQDRCRRAVLTWPTPSEPTTSAGNSTSRSCGGMRARPCPRRKKSDRSPRRLRSWTTAVSPIRRHCSSRS
jgi:single-stranded-DNA-specific exonuclease